MIGSGVDALASERKITGGGSEDQFNKVLKYSYDLTDSLSDNSFPFADFSGADKVTHFCLSCQKLPNASLMSTYRRRFSPAHATYTTYWFCDV